MKTKLIQKIKELTDKRFWTSEQWKTGNDIERLVWFISTLSPHNLWRGQEAIDHAIQSAIDDKGKEIEKEIYKHYKDETVASGHRIWNEALDLSVSIVDRLSELSKKEE